MNDCAILERRSPFDFAATMQRVTDAIETAGMTVFARLDHEKAARQAGLVMPPTAVLVYGNAKAGTPIMLACPSVALDLPLHVLIREDGGVTYVSFRPIAEVLRALGVPEALSNRLSPGQQVIQDTLR